ncbi:hypothetical protein JQ586_12600 [Bradyrhizobium jicamae]|nr:hypothetical protein [Bradyrhizobium jicamae]MBR0934209.1 hypothetical protein [Bradyrhizobium jicamae]
MRARFSTDGDGKFSFRSSRPTAYPVPHDGPVRVMLAAAAQSAVRAYTVVVKSSRGPAGTIPVGLIERWLS